MLATLTNPIDTIAGTNIRNQYAKAMSIEVIRYVRWGRFLNLSFGEWMGPQHRGQLFIVSLFLIMVA